MSSSTDRYITREVDGTRWKDKLIELQKAIFPADTIIAPARGHWWIVFHAGQPVAFAAMRDVKGSPGLGYMTMAGVLPAHRGRGLQARLIRARLRKARQLGYRQVITTTYDNPKSINNLIDAGFRAYQPAHKWMAEHTCYWVKHLS